MFEPSLVVAITSQVDVLGYAIPPPSSIKPLNIQVLNNSHLRYKPKIKFEL